MNRRIGRIALVIVVILLLAASALIFFARLTGESTGTEDPGGTDRSADALPPQPPTGRGVDGRDDGADRSGESAKPPTEATDRSSLEPSEFPDPESAEQQPMQEVDQTEERPVVREDAASEEQPVVQEEARTREHSATSAEPESESVERVDRDRRPEISLQPVPPGLELDQLTRLMGQPSPVMVQDAELGTLLAVIQLADGEWEVVAGSEVAAAVGSVVPLVRPVVSSLLTYIENPTEPVLESVRNASTDTGWPFIEAGVLELSTRFEDVPTHARLTVVTDLNRWRRERSRELHLVLKTRIGPAFAIIDLYLRDGKLTDLVVQERDAADIVEVFR